MPLVFEDEVREGIPIISGVSPFYLGVEGKYLSRQYEVTPLDKAWVEGEILNVSRIVGELTPEESEAIRSYVLGRKVKFYLSVSFSDPYNSLYFDEPSWSVLRDAGIFPGEHRVKVKLRKLIVEKAHTGERKELDLYPYREVKV